MVITPNNHQRVVHMRMLDWFFAESADSQTPFCPLPLEKFDHSQALLWYLSDKKLLIQGEVPDSFRDYYVFTVTDIRYLLINRFDLTNVNYIVNDVSFEHYEKLYNIAYVNRLPLSGLHGLEVDFSQKDAMQHLDDLVDDFISEKTPTFFKNVIINLHEIINIAKNPKYHDWLSNNDLQLTISYYDEQTGGQQKTTIDTQKFHQVMASFSSETLSSSRFFGDKTTVEKQIQHLSAAILGIENPSSTNMSKGELLLAAVVCGFHARHNPIGQLFWETQIEKELTANVQPCREADIDLLSKIRNVHVP